MVRLTDYEQRMLDGQMGEFKQKALKKIVEYANALGAEELCTVTKATVYLGYHPYLDVVKSEDYNEIFSRMVLCEHTDKIYEIDSFSDECFSQTCSSPCDYFCHEEINLSKEVFEKNRKFLDITREAGVNITGSCTPYLSGWIPLRGEHFVSTESSNILFGNSVYGACANADGLEATAWSAICGRTPLWGNHILENRYATHIIDVQCKAETPFDWDILGHALGRLLTDGNERPVLVGNFQRPDLTRLKKFFTSLATTSGCELCHIVGSTAEAPTLEAALAGHEAVRTIVVTQIHLAFQHHDQSVIIRQCSERTFFHLYRRRTESPKEFAVRIAASLRHDLDFCGRTPAPGGGAVIGLIFFYDFITHLFYRMAGFFLNC